VLIKDLSKGATVAGNPARISVYKGNRCNIGKLRVGVIAALPFPMLHKLYTCAA